MEGRVADNYGEGKKETVESVELELVFTICRMVAFTKPVEKVEMGTACRQCGVGIKL